MRRCLWQMPEKVEVIPFYTKRARVKNIIRAKDIETPACNDSNLEVAKKEKSFFPTPFFEKKKKYGYIEECEITHKY